MKKLVLMPAALAVAALASSAMAAPLGRNTPAPLASFVPPPYATGTTHSVADVVISSGDAGSLTVPSGTFTRIDTPIKIKCANNNGCTILVNSMVQVTAAASGGNWAICPLLNGSEFAQSCGYIGIISTTDGYVQNSSTGSFSVAKGTYTVESDVYMDDGGAAHYYNTTYTVTTP